MDKLWTDDELFESMVADFSSWWVSIEIEWVSIEIIQTNFETLINWTKINIDLERNFVRNINLIITRMYKLKLSRDRNSFRRFQYSRYC